MLKAETVNQAQTGVDLPTRLRPRTVRDHAIVSIGILAISATVYFEGGSSGSIAALYLAAVFAVFYLFDPRPALAQTALLGASCGAALLMREDLATALGDWIPTMTMVCVVGFLMARIRRQIEWLLARLEKAARTDALTGLLNRQGFDERFGPELERAHRGERLISLIVADIDHFKEVNDRFGHHAGDKGVGPYRRSWPKRSARSTSSRGWAGRSLP